MKVWDPNGTSKVSPMDWLMLKTVERDWLMNLRGPGYRFEKLMITKE